MTTPQTIAHNYTRLLTLWPKDALRPTQPFTTAILHRASRYGVSPPSSSSTPSTPPSSSSSPPKPSSTSPSAPATPTHEHPHLNALFSLLENRYTRKYPLSPGVLKPVSAPLHYENLMREIERAPGRSWWEAKIEAWRGKIRWA
ncbi:hypothetical protein IAQ61_010507 [Plenodomus lingam]|uniref:uncharacterized protein n=1 Tax=Leptosphaeria maculans TaxID=5022 RepID=UPI003327A981|nr:hypothetical protein IAQ61_010507 [Plenodomus lingam]